MERKGDSVQAVKTWLFPAIVTVLSTIIWMDVTELKNDVKQLLAQSNVDKTRIDNLQRQVDLLNARTMQLPVNDNPGEPKPVSYVPGKEIILSDRKRKVSKSQYFSTI